MITNTIYHLSHNDLDGFGCQYITYQLFDNIVFFNSGYGKQIDENFKKILKKIKKNDTLLITDLNLTAEQASFINSKSKSKNFNIILLDHHGTGETISKKYDWYHLDTSKSGTQLTFDKFFDQYSDFNISYTVELINVYDLWKEKEDKFIQGKTLNGIVMSYKNFFPEGFENLERELIFRLIKESSFMLSITSGNVIKAEEHVYSMVRDFLSSKVENAKNLPFNSLKAHFLYQYFDKYRFEKYIIERRKVEVYFDLPQELFQELSQLRFKRDNVDIAVTVSSMGTVSMRASNEEGNSSRVDIWAENYFNGGGHPKASGGIIKTGKLKKLSYTDAIDIFYSNLRYF